VTFSVRQRQQIPQTVINRKACHVQIHTAPAVWSIIFIQNYHLHAVPV